MSKEVQVTLRGVPMLANTLLFIALLSFKVTGAVTWPWWVIFAPFWVPLAITGIVVVGVVGAALLTRR